MNCQDIRENLSAYLDGELDKQKSSNMAAHLLACPHCRLECEQLQMVNDLWQQLPEIEPPPEFMSGLNKKLAAKTAGAHKLPIWHRARRVAQQPWYKFAAVAAVFGMAIGITTLWEGEGADIINNPQITKAPSYQEELEPKVNKGTTTPPATDVQIQTQKEPTTKTEQPTNSDQKDQQVTTPKNQTNGQQVATNNTSPEPAAQTESFNKPGAVNMASNISTLSIRIDVPRNEIDISNQGVRNIATKYNAQLVANNNEYDLKFPLGTDISLLLDEFRTIGEVNTVPIKDLTKEYRAQIIELEQKKTELKSQQDNDSLHKIENIQKEIDNKYAKIKELSSYINIVVKIIS